MERLIVEIIMWGTVCFSVLLFIGGLFTGNSLEYNYYLNVGVGFFFVSLVVTSVLSCTALLLLYKHADSDCF